MKIFILTFFISLAYGDISVNVNFKQSINEISDKFISNEIDFGSLMSIVKHQKNFTVLSPSYLRLNNFLSHLRSDENNERHSTEIAAIFQTLNQNKITPVIVIDYNVTNFDPILLLQDLKRATNLDIKECVWQLGDYPLDISSKSEIKKYGDDLKTLKILCESVKRDRKLEWNVAAVGTFIELADDRLYFDVEGADFGRTTQAEILTSKNSLAMPKTQDAKVWMTINENNHLKGNAMKSSCDESCLIDGLFYANVLGESAKKGYDVLFTTTTPTNDNFKQAINKMHSALIGTKIFNVKNSKSASATRQSSVYAYCAKKMNGAVTLMGINYSNTRVKAKTKLSSSIASNSVVSQYLISIADGHVMLNNERFNGTITPAYKFKKISKNSIDLTIPPYSIVFWMIKNANVKVCRGDNEMNKLRSSIVASSSSSSDDLLKMLAARVLEKSRVKRQLTLPKLDLKLASLMPSKINQRSIKDVFFNKNTEIYKVAAPSIDAINPLQSSENPSLPNGDIFLLINDGALDVGDYVDADIQYPIERRQQQKKSSRKLKQHIDMQRQPSEASYDYIENSRTQKSVKKSPPTQQPATTMMEIGELFEIEKSSINDYSSDSKAADSKNVEIKSVMRELEPTYRQSKKALLAAKRKFDQNQLMELLKDATLEEVDRSEIHNADDFQVIDLTREDDDYEQYEDDDEDGFFDDKHRVRTRRAIDYRKNEIPRYGDPFDSSEEDDEEDLNDANFYLPPPRRDDEVKFLSTLKPVIVNENSPLGVKVIDIFSKSLDDIIFTVHKNLISWWYVFAPPTTN